MTSEAAPIAAPGSDQFLRVEGHGIDAIPEHERHGRPRELAFIWAGAFFDYVSVLTASLLTIYFGLGVWDGLAALALGTLAGAVILGLLSHTGARTGLPQMAFTRRIFGPAGMRVGAAATLFLAVGWFAVDTVIAAQAGSQLLQVAGVSAATAGRLTFPLALAVAAISVAVAVFGHQTIKVLETWGAVAFGVLAIAIFAVLAPQFHWTAAPSAAGGAYPAAFILGFMACFALVASWFPFASDYSRYLPARSSGRGLTWWPVVGVGVPMLLLGLFGLLLPTIDPKLAAGDAGVLGVVSHHAPGWLAIPFFVFVVVGELLSNYLDVYTAGLVTLTLGVRLQRWQTALGCGVLGAALAAYAVLVNDFHTAYQQFLELTYLWAPAWAAIVLLAFFVLRRGAVGAALAAWLLGTLVSLLFVNYPNLYPGVQAFNQPLIDLLHGADLSGLVSMLVAAGVYTGLVGLVGARSR
jgi:NCS1 family nucleobase:cation symporter-1